MKIDVEVIAYNFCIILLCIFLGSVFLSVSSLMIYGTYEKIVYEKQCNNNK